MTATSIDAPAKATPKVVLVSLLAVAIFINYVDRGNLATAAPLLKGELSLSNKEIGVLTSAFFWVYAPGQLLAAWLVQRINAYRALALGLLLWSLATILTGFAEGFAALLGLRVLLGLGESAGFPASSKLLAQHLPRHRLGLANGMICAGIALGPAVGTYMGGLLIVQAGWRSLFFVFGAVSLLWLPTWLLATRAPSANRAHIDRREPSFAELLSKKELWGAAFGHFACNYSFYLVISWLPLYLVKAHGYSVAEMAKLGGIVYGLSALIGISAGTLADRLMERGTNATIVRKGMMCTGLAVGIGSMLACSVDDPQLSVAGLLLFSVTFGLASFNLFAIGQTLAGAGATAKWMGVQNCVGNIAGIVAPIVTGVTIDRTGGFGLAFLIAAAILVLGLICWGIVIRRVEPIEWSGAS